jgi:hypothetical protein
MPQVLFPLNPDVVQQRSETIFGQGRDMSGVTQLSRRTNGAKPGNRFRRLPRLISLACICLILSGISMAAASITSWADDCDTVPTGVETTD